MNVKRLLKPQDIVVLATVQHLSPAMIAPIAGISRQAVWKILRDQGVNTSKGTGGATRVKYECSFCGKPCETERQRFRDSINHYCSKECYYADIENQNYHPWKQGRRLARAIVSQHFHLKDGNVVHHKDGDNRNNDRSNLAVYRSQADHVSSHRGGKARPIWDGADLS